MLSDQRLGGPVRADVLEKVEEKIERGRAADRTGSGRAGCRRHRRGQDIRGRRLVL